VTDIRCDHKKFGEISGDLMEIRCRSVFCGYRADRIVLHQFKIPSGEMVATMVYKEPLQEGGD